MDEDGDCINYELNNKRLRNNLKRFKAPAWDKMTWFGTDLAVGEMNLMVDLDTSWDGDVYNGRINYGRLLTMAIIWYKADDTTGDLFIEYDPEELQNNSPSGAFHHAYWSAMITRAFGADFAQKFTYAHETRVDSVIEQTFMDMHNNQVGIEIALANPNATDLGLQKAVLESLYNGELYVLTDADEIYFSGAQCLNCDWRVEAPKP